MSSEIRIPVPWGYIAGVRWGPAEKQPVLAIHGWQENAGSFKKLVQLLPDDLAVLCIDMPGHGHSSPYPRGMPYYIFWDGVVIVRRIVKYFNWKSVSIMGHSMGGAIGFMYAASYPDEVDKLISFDIVHPYVKSPSRIAEDTGKSIDKFLDYEQKAVDGPFYEHRDMIDLVFDRYDGSLTREATLTLMERGMAPCTSQRGLYRFTRDVRLKVAALGLVSLDLVLEFASKITCEVLNIQGTNGLVHDEEYYHMVLDKIRETAKKCVFYKVEGTHHLHLNTPELISDYVTDFLLNSS